MCVLLSFALEFCSDKFKSVSEGQMMDGYYREFIGCVGEPEMTLTHGWNSTHLSVNLFC